MIQSREVASPGVLIRDYLIFVIKLLLDGFKDLVMIQVSLLAFALDLFVMVFTGSRRSRLFYTVLALGERIDLWLNLYGPAQRAAGNPDGLFGESRAGDDTLLGELEELVRREPATARPAAGVRPGVGLPRG
ncbi:MAG TPA: hypothetical protein VEW03_15705 [Longimicrobiaceae bacterium]|nr:hypothetical protein [Longimicrobiaceae bacterium]